MMHLRGQAVGACIQRFAGRPMVWGSVDCVRIAAHNLHQLGVGVPMLKGLRYASERGARKALKGLGFGGLGEALDALGLARIPPAMATDADLVGMVTDAPGWDLALTVHAGNGKLFGVTSEGVAGFLKADFGTPEAPLAVAAWKVFPCRR